MNKFDIEITSSSKEVYVWLLEMLLENQFYPAYNTYTQPATIPPITTIEIWDKWFRFRFKTGDPEKVKWLLDDPDTGVMFANNPIMTDEVRLKYPEFSDIEVNHLPF